MTILVGQEMFNLIEKLIIGNSFLRMESKKLNIDQMFEIEMRKAKQAELDDEDMFEGGKKDKNKKPKEDTENEIINLET